MARATTKAKTEKPADEVAPEPTEIIAFKGTDKNGQCRGYQFEVGKTYTHVGEVEACSSGFHSCENPLDVWGYYGLGEDNRFFRVRAGGKIARHRSDSKIASGSITIEAEIKLPDFIKAAVKWVIDATKGKGDDPTGDYAQIGSSEVTTRRIGSSGNSARIGSSRYYAQIGSSGYYAQIGSSAGTYAQNRQQRELPRAQILAAWRPEPRADRQQRELRADRCNSGNSARGSAASGVLRADRCNRRRVPLLRSRGPRSQSQGRCRWRYLPRLSRRQATALRNRLRRRGRDQG